MTKYDMIVNETLNVIDNFKLPLNPTKKKDPRTKNWAYAGSVELDALPIPFFIDLINKQIEKYWDSDVEKQRIKLEVVLSRIFRKKYIAYLKDLVEKLSKETAKSITQMYEKRLQKLANKKEKLDLEFAKKLFKKLEEEKESDSES